MRIRHAESIRLSEDQMQSIEHGVANQLCIVFCVLQINTPHYELTTFYASRKWLTRLCSSRAWPASWAAAEAVSSAPCAA